MNRTWSISSYLLSKLCLTIRKRQLSVILLSLSLPPADLLKQKEVVNLQGHQFNIPPSESFPSRFNRIFYWMVNWYFTCLCCAENLRCNLTRFDFVEMATWVIHNDFRFVSRFISFPETLNWISSWFIGSFYWMLGSAARKGFLSLRCQCDLFFC